MTFKEKFKTNLIVAAKSYSLLLNCRIIISIDEIKRTYIIRFYETNFLHLCGVKTDLTPLEFYNKCLTGIINIDDFNFGNSTSIKGYARLKIKHLINIGHFFDENIKIQENFQKGSIKCLIASSNNTYTLGFVDAKYNVRPQTILDKNHLDESKPIYVVKPIIKSL